MLASLTYYLPDVKSHMDCRHADKVAVVSTLERDGVAWLAAEADIGFDDFLAVICQGSVLGIRGVYRLDLSGFEALGPAEYRSIIADGDVNQFCSALFQEGRSILLLDGVALDGVNSRKFIVELKEFVRTARDVASEVLVIIRSYRSYTAAGVEYVTLMALDEAECKTYVDLHPNSGYVTQDDIAYGFIHEQTAGYPERIDRLLLRLKSIDLTELMAFGSWAIDEGQGLPEYLDRAFKKIAEDEGSDEYCLLKGLSIFSFGESLETLKRFEGARRIRPSAIDKLVNSSLADPADNFEVGLQRGEQQRYIVVKKSVQDHLLFCLGERQLAKAYEDAVSVYFGRDWRLRNYQLSSSFQMAVRRLNSVAEQNASIILTRFVTDEIENIESTEKSILDRIAVLQFYLQKLDAGDRYLFVTRLVKVLLPKLEPYEDNHLVRDIRFRYARALRMLGQHDQSIREFKKLSEVKNDVRTRARIYLNLAYSYKSKGDHASALQYVDRILGLKCKGESVYAAESIKYLLVGGVDKSKRLHELVEKARKDKCHVAANNIEIDLVDEISGEPQQLEGYKRLMSVTRKTADEYNYFDTVSKYCSLAVKLGVPLSAKEVRPLLDSYKFACAQWQAAIFSRAHAALWKVFEDQSDIYALIQLYRHSSILQRLMNKGSIEVDYLKRLVAKITKADVGRIVGSVDQVSMRYFFQRAVSHNLLSHKQVELLK